MDFQYPPCAYNAWDGYTNADLPPYSNPYYAPPPPYSTPDMYAYPAAPYGTVCTGPCCYALMPAYYYANPYAYAAAIPMSGPVPAPTTQQAAPAPKPKREYANKHKAPCTTAPTLRVGTRLLHTPGDYVEVRLVDGRPWEEGAPRQLAFESVAAPADVTVRELVKRLGGEKGFAIGEVIEDGDGVWRCGIVVKDGDDAMGKGIGKIGWTKKREGAGPIWVAVWKP